MKKIFTLAAAVLASFNLWAAEPTFESYDWTEESVQTVAGNHDGITISYAGLGSLANTGGHWYIPMNQNLKNSDSPWKYFGVAATQKIDSISILYCPNGSNKTSIAWVAWGKDVTPNQYTLAHGETAGTTSSKSWDNAIWETIDLSAVEDAYTVYIARSIREFREADATSNLPNFGSGQTINILGIRVYAGAAVPVTDPVATVTIEGPEAIYVGQKASYTAATDVKANAYKWLVNGAEQEGATTAKFDFTPDAEGTYAIVCQAKNDNNTDYVASAAINLVASVKPVLEQVAVSESTIWDWTKAASVKEIKWDETTTPAKDIDTVLLANIDGMNNNADFNSQALLFAGQYPVRDSKYCQGPYISFKTTVAGYVQVDFSNTGTKDDPRYVAVNGVVNTVYEGSLDTKTTKTSARIAVPAGDVVITGALADGTTQYLRIYKIVFMTGEIPTAINNVEESVKAVKVIRDGKLFIEKNGVLYNAQGVVVK